MDKAKLSIIIVNYNAEKLLKNCIASIYQQTPDIAFDIWVVDNNSRDNSVAMLRENRLSGIESLERETWCATHSVSASRSSQAWACAENSAGCSYFAFYFYFTYSSGRLHAERSGGLG